MRKEQGIKRHMKNDIINQMQRGFQSAFIDQNQTSNLAYKPQFVSNNHKEGKKVLSSIEDELLLCEEFNISVAFITMSGLTPLLQTLKELEKRNIYGKILTTDYLSFSEPKALRKLAELNNITLRIFSAVEAKEGFHTKGYIFRKEEIYRIITGSSNVTLGALTKNKEWNSRIVSTEHGEYAHQIIEEFTDLWESEYTKNFDEYIEHYTVNYEIVKKQKEIARQSIVPPLEQYKLKPNKMQVEFVTNLERLWDSGKRKALLISATGTGKTYASAFALRHASPRRALFLVHREQIAKQAIKSYINVFGETKKFGLLSGNNRNFDADYLFATMQMMAKPEIHRMFRQDEFDIIVIDEAHRAGASSYQTIMEYFEPRFWLGMTASPERTDNFDVYQLFEHNIAYEIRLQQAMEENLLCPFHYFGITDLTINGEIFDDNTSLKHFSHLVSEQRIDYIIDQIEYYGFCGERVKGLVFCSRKEEARELSDKFNILGYNTVFLCGEDSQEVRVECIERLTNDESSDKLDYIFTVDIFNEGVDIPEINQVIMLRPTESPIVFVQQLGRGLRKADNKEYVVILDFIGNYKNNFMIPIALSGDRTYNKDNIRNYLMEGGRIIPGSSTIHFDEISKKSIFASIDKVSTTKKLLIEKYNLLKNKLGKIPTVLDFYDYGEIDPILFINYAGSYHNFLQMADKEYEINLSEKETRMLEFISSNIVNGKRPHELIILKLLMRNEEFTKYDVEAAIRETYQMKNSNESFNSAINLLCGRFMNTQSEKNKYADIEILAKHGGYYKRIVSFYQKIKFQNFINK